MLISTVTALAIGARQQPLQSVEEVRAIADFGLEGDRYSTGDGSYQKEVGRRQVTLFDTRHLLGTDWTLAETRRNIGVEGDLDIMRLLAFENSLPFKVGEATLRAFAYCDPCGVPSKISGKSDRFGDTFWGRGGLIAEILQGGMIRVGDTVTADLKKYR